MRFPQEYRDIIKKCEQKNPSDINAATNEAYSRIKRRKSFKEYIEALALEQIRNMVHIVRYDSNSAGKEVLRVIYEEYSPGQFKKKGPHNTPKVISHHSESVQRAAAILLAKRIDGRQYQDILKEEMFEIAEAEKNRSAGHLLNSRWLINTEKVLKDKQTPKDLTDEQIFAIYQKSQREVYGSKKAE